jgi:integral membrane protein (TIGR01906 family)
LPIPPTDNAEPYGSDAAVTEKTPTPPNRQDHHLDSSADSDEPAFDWMKPAAQPTPAQATPGQASSTRTTPASADPAKAPNGSGAIDAAKTGDPVTGGLPQAGSRADRKAAESAAEPAESGNGAAAGSGAATNGAASGKGSVPGKAGSHFREPLPTSALQVRPPEEEVQRRNAEREQAAKSKPVLPRVMQVALAVFYPVILLVLAVRAVTSPLFLWVEYNRPGFPGDGYGFSTDDRMTYGSYTVDYLGNWAGPRYLGELVNRSGDQLFKDGEVSHMADVKLVILSAFGAGILLTLLSIIAIIYLRRRSTGGVRRGLFAGSIVTLVIIIGLGVLAFLGWEQFFTEFHRIFFASGSWTFALEDTLIRLFPGQFWIDAGIVIAALVLLTAIITLILTWPTRKRRGLVSEDKPAASEVNDTAGAAEPKASVKGSSVVS